MLRIWHLNDAVAASVAPYAFDGPESAACEAVRVPAGRVCSLATFESAEEGTAHVLYGTSDGRFGEVVVRGSTAAPPPQRLVAGADEFSSVQTSRSGAAVVGIAVTRLAQVGGHAEADRR